MPLDIVHSTCPHDCPSACALEVERIDSHHIGKVRGAAANSYTAGVICAKVARYAERVHHPDRLDRPLRRVGDRPLDLTYMEYELLKFLASHPGKVFTRETLLSRVWGYDYYGGARTVDVHVRRLRAKLGEEQAGLIQTVRSVGYSFGQSRWRP